MIVCDIVEVWSGDQKPAKKVPKNKPWVDVLDDGEDVDHVLVQEDGAAGLVVGLGVEAVLLQLELDARLHADRAEQGHFLQAVHLQ